jgi:histidyl-tRNA synthetase
MEKKVKAVTGTQDWIGEDLEKRLQVSKAFASVMKRFNAEPVETPILEKLEVFQKNLGETSDIVQKEMFTLGEEEVLVLRPEGTAGLLRALIDRGWEQKLPLKLYYDGPMFRRETPQKGRFRQFDQVGLELLGYKADAGDGLSILMAYSFLEKLGLSSKVKLEINYLGSEEERKAYREELVKYLQGNKEKLSQESQERLLKNPLRVLDSKQKEDKDIVSSAPLLESFLGEESTKLKNSLIKSLEQLNIPFVYNSKLVRGLDYYTGLVFEFISDEIGAQSTVLAGGRYDKLSENMGGTPIPAIGWAAGKERLSYLISLEESNKPLIGIVTTESSCMPTAYALAQEIFKRTSYAVEIPANDSLNKKMKKLNKLKAKYAVIIGPTEVEKGVYSFKDMESGEQKEVDLKTLLLKILISSIGSGN